MSCDQLASFSKWASSGDRSPLVGITAVFHDVSGAPYAARPACLRGCVIPADHAPPLPGLLRVLGRLPPMDDATRTCGRRRRSLKGGNRGKVWRGWAGRYGDSVAGGSGWVRWVGRVWAAGSSDRGGWRADAGELGGRPIPERRARACGDAVSSRAWPPPVDDRRHRRTVFGCRAVGGVIMKCRS